MTGRHRLNPLGVRIRAEQADAHSWAGKDKAWESGSSQQGIQQTTRVSERDGSTDSLNCRTRTGETH